MLNKKLSAFLLAMLAISGMAMAQPTLQKMQQKLVAIKQNTAQSFYRFEITSKMKNQGSLLFSADMAVPKANVQTWLAEVLGLRQDMDAFKKKGKSASYGGTQISKLQQYFKGIKVEHGIVNQVDKDDKVQLLQIEFYSVPADLSITPVLSEEAALQKALKLIGAQKYVWEDYEGTEPEYAKPTGELVIVEDINHSEGSFCLAYKFDVFAAKPLSRDYIYVNAITGKIVFRDAIIKHLDGNYQHTSNTKKDLPSTTISLPKKAALHVESLSEKITKPTAENFVPASGFTKYSNTQNFTTAKVTPTQFVLHGASADNSTPYFTFNGNHKTLPILAGDITDFTDADNDWSDGSYIADTTNAALDIHWGIEQVIDYWWKIHDRKSYDNNNAKIISIFHYGAQHKGAFWNKEAMFYGDGTQDGKDWNAVTSVDITGHELSHAVCDFTAGLVYKRESGALNEGFSDIWGACIDNYVNKKYPGMAKKPFLIGEEIMEDPGTHCIRDMAEPLSRLQPDTYKDNNNFWFDTNVEYCPYPINSEDSVFGNDYCGVHVNSGVLNKWFYLIAHGDSGINTKNYHYKVDSMGFEKAEKIAFYTEMILTPNSGFEAARIASLNAIQILATDFNNGGVEIADTANVIKAWKAVGVITDSIYNMANTPVFKSNIFNSIGVGKYGTIWAGSVDTSGLYKFNDGVWQRTTLTRTNVTDIKTDRNGGIWVAQSGRTGAQALGGGLNYFKDSSNAFQFFSTIEGLPTRNARSLYIDNTILLDTFKRVWIATYADITGGTSRSGSAARGLKSPVTIPTNYFRKMLPGIGTYYGFCQTIAGNDSEVWVYCDQNRFDTAKGHWVSQIIRYRTTDTAYLGMYDSSNTLLPRTFQAKAMYYDSVYKKWWLGMFTGGIYTYTPATSTWNQINFTTIFPAGTIVNNNAITGDTRGNIYIGTSKGYVYFGSPNSSVVLNPLDSAQYKRYTMADGLPSNNVKGIAIDYRANRILMATDSGIVFKYLLCKDCVNTGPAYSVLPGNWVNPGIWAGGKVPGVNSNVIVKHPIVITSDANCNSLKLEGTGKITVNAGIKLNIEGLEYKATEW
jgi:Zn-dependent metalloprotease